MTYWMNRGMGSADRVSRHGGDEFVILLSEVAQPGDAAIVAEIMLSALRTSCPIGLDGLRLTASIGIASYPDDGTDGETLTKRADSAMYCAKRVGGNNHQFFNADISARRRAFGADALRAGPGQLRPACGTPKYAGDADGLHPA